MSDIFSSALSEQLDKHNISLEQWRELVQRLLDYGVLCRDDSQVEAELYDRFVRIHELVNDYLALMGVRFQHDTTFHFVRVLPPGARLAGMEDESDEPFNGGFRSRLNQHEIALILVLRAEYDKSLREGSIDEKGCATLSLEAIALAMKSLLHRNLPENISERRQAFKRLRQLRLIHFFAESDVDSGESWIKIRPLIINLVSNEWLDQLRSNLAENLLLVEEPEVEEPVPAAVKKTKVMPKITKSIFEI
ncbi:MAG TPA: DUF4194 domain-containing protein [Cellvibrio sp.]|nr:DUF4194 domain-containing protein [Cellvibrio sp.]